ncbi:phage repressor protein CI [Vibrio alginolyticus]|uniref:phage repressor protein CI n=1 Tax=Vibrio alginolyticus TaxID=663 RepID=UPI00215E4C20|nr:phage repressor protein CI [Vibrio alginolyticus]MCS0179279.1 helix-turn-helix domain-containing protein [Vibrio alginolyticus]
MDAKKPILPYEYLKGNEFVEKLKEVLNCKSHQELADLLRIPKSTFSTWSKHERTSHELTIRLHLALGIPIAELALSKDDKNRIAQGGVEVAKPSLDYMSRMLGEQSTQLQQAQNDVVSISSFCLTNGQLLDTGKIPYAIRIFNSWNLDKNNSIEIETNDGRFIVDKTQNDAMSGDYLIDMNGRMSINHIQRLPNKLAVVFGNSTVEVAEEDIKVLGRVAVTLKKD